MIRGNRVAVSTEKRTFSRRWFLERCECFLAVREVVVQTESSVNLHEFLVGQRAEHQTQNVVVAFCTCGLLLLQLLFGDRQVLLAESEEKAVELFYVRLQTFVRNTSAG